MATVSNAARPAPLSRVRVAIVTRIDVLVIATGGVHYGLMCGVRARARQVVRGGWGGPHIVGRHCLLRGWVVSGRYRVR